MATPAPTTTDSSTGVDEPAAHLLTPQRVDQLVIEHFDPADYPRYPTDVMAQYDALQDQIEQESHARVEDIQRRGLSLTNPADADRRIVRAYHLWLHDAETSVAELEERITARLSARRQVIDGLWRELEPVAARRDDTAETRYLGAQQWLWHVHEAATAGIARSDKRASVIAVAEALAEHARANGVFLAGVALVQQERGIASSTWTRAYSWLVDAGLALTLSKQGRLSQVERALAIGSENHSHVQRWRSVIQLQHPAGRVLKPAKWAPPSRREARVVCSVVQVVSTDHGSVDKPDGAARRTGPASPELPTRKPRRVWRRFDPATEVLHGRLVRLAERLTGYLPTAPPGFAVVRPPDDPSADRVVPRAAAR